MDSSRADDLVPSELKGAKQFRESAWVVVIGPWNLMAKWFLLTLVRWQEDLAASFVHQMGWNQGNRSQPSRSHAGDGDWQGIVEDGGFLWISKKSAGVFLLTSPGVAWRLQLGSWDNVVEKAYFFGYYSLVGQTRKSKQLWLWLWFFA